MLPSQLYLWILWRNTTFFKNSPWLKIAHDSFPGIGTHPKWLMEITFLTQVYMGYNLYFSLLQTLAQEMPFWRLVWLQTMLLSWTQLSTSLAAQKPIHQQSFVFIGMAWVCLTPQLAIMLQRLQLLSVREEVQWSTAVFQSMSMVMDPQQRSRSRFIVSFFFNRNVHKVLPKTSFN